MGTTSKTKIAGLICTNCKTTETPLWRSGPEGNKTLCNACGVRWKKGKLIYNGVLSLPPTPLNASARVAAASARSTSIMAPKPGKATKAPKVVKVAARTADQNNRIGGARKGTRGKKPKNLRNKVAAESSQPPSPTTDATTATAVDCESQFNSRSSSGIPRSSSLSNSASVVGGDQSRSVLERSPSLLKKDEFAMTRSQSLDINPGEASSFLSSDMARSPSTQSPLQYVPTNASVLTKTASALVTTTRGTLSSKSSPKLRSPIAKTYSSPLASAASRKKSSPTLLTVRKYASDSASALIQSTKHTTQRISINVNSAASLKDKLLALDEEIAFEEKKEREQKQRMLQQQQQQQQQHHHHQQNQLVPLQPLAITVSIHADDSLTISDQERKQLQKQLQAAAENRKMALLLRSMNISNRRNHHHNENDGDVDNDGDEDSDPIDADSRIDSDYDMDPFHCASPIEHPSDHDVVMSHFEEISSPVVPHSRKWPSTYGSKLFSEQCMLAENHASLTGIHDLLWSTQSSMSDSKYDDVLSIGVQEDDPGSPLTNRSLQQQQQHNLDSNFITTILSPDNDIDSCQSTSIDLGSDRELSSSKASGSEAMDSSPEVSRLSPPHTNTPGYTKSFRGCVPNSPSALVKLSPTDIQTDSHMGMNSTASLHALIRTKSSKLHTPYLTCASHLVQLCLHFNPDDDINDYVKSFVFDQCSSLVSLYFDYDYNKHHMKALQGYFCNKQAFSRSICSLRELLSNVELNDFSTDQIADMFGNDISILTDIARTIIKSQNSEENAADDKSGSKCLKNFDPSRKGFWASKDVIERIVLS